MATIVPSTEREKAGKWKGELGTVASHLLSSFGVYTLLLIHLWGCKGPRVVGILVQVVSVCRPLRCPLLFTSFAPPLPQGGRRTSCAQLPSSLAIIIPLLLAPTEPHSTALAMATYPQTGTGSPDCESSLHLD